MTPKSNPAPDPSPSAPKLPADATPLELFFKGNRLQAAGVLFVLLEAVPLAGLVLSLREGGDIWTIMSAMLLAGGLLPPLGVALGHRWAYLLGQYLVWGSFGGVILRVLQNGFTLVYLVPGMLLGVLLVALSPPRSSTQPRQAEKKPESFGVWIKENLEAIIIAFIMALVIRCFCIEVFKIPSSSMEPILLGDVSEKHSRESCPFGAYHVPLDTPTASGDRIMVTKYYYAFSSVERYDVIVFKFPLNQSKNFIKRVVGLPNESIKIYRGNLYVKKPGQDKFHIASRTWRTQNSLWIDVSRATHGYLGTQATFEQAWESVGNDTPGQLPWRVAEGELSTQARDASGQKSVQFNLRRIPDDGPPVSAPVDDVRLLFDFEITSPKGQVFAEISNAYGRFEAVLDTEGGSQLVCYLPSRENRSRFEKQIVPLRDVQLSMDRHFRLELLVYDGTAHVRVNDGERAKFQFIDTREDLLEVDAPDRRVSFGTRGLTFKVNNLSVGRDIFYRGRDRSSRDLREDEELAIPAGKYVMMGDNVASSHDSRAWLEHTFTLKNGKTIVCEEQQVIRYGDFLRTLKEKYDLPRVPDIGIDGDEHGNEIPINFEDIAADGEKTREFRFVDEKFIVGKALWIWWPPGRWFHLIR